MKCDFNYIQQRTIIAICLDVNTLGLKIVINCVLGFFFLHYLIGDKIITNDANNDAKLKSVQIIIKDFIFALLRLLCLL